MLLALFLGICLILTKSYICIFIGILIIITSIKFIYDEYGLKIINRTGRFLYMNHDDLEKYIYTNLIPFIKPNSNIIIKPKEIEVPHLKDKKLEEDINNYFNNLKDNLDKVDEQPKIRTLSKRK